MKLHVYVKKAVKLPPTVLAKKIFQKIVALLLDFLNKRSTLGSEPRTITGSKIAVESRVCIDELDCTSISVDKANYLFKMYSQHHFDLLGSGWIKNSYKSDDLGMDGFGYDENLDAEDIDGNGEWFDHLLLPSHLDYSRKVWRMIDDGYNPIDWQKDLKSGYRWSASQWYKDQKIGHMHGVDIRGPWELARFQHLPQLAIFTQIVAGESSKLLLEFRNQVLDFISSNPPRMGANWVCTLEVGIRASNWLLAYDLFTQVEGSAEILEEDFKQIFANSIYDHGIHIINNLEYSDDFTSNHYLANLCGLIYISCYLESRPEVNNWLAFGIQELIREFNKQFNEDGTNFEASTSYHRFSSEMVLFTVALVLGLPDSKRESLKEYKVKTYPIPRLKESCDQEFDPDEEMIFPGWFFDRLYKAGCFTRDLKKSTNEVPQVGDNDSGRFFKLSPTGRFRSGAFLKKMYSNLPDNLQDELLYWDENYLDHDTLVSAFCGIYPEISTCKHGLEKTIIASLSKGKSIEYSSESYFVPHAFTPHIRSQSQFESRWVHNCDNKEIDLKRNLNLYPYPEFGLYMFKSDFLFLSIFLGPVGQHGMGGHAHNDKLSVELNVNGKDILTDPGTYLYTADPVVRNEFRSTAFHNTIVTAKKEQIDWLKGNDGLFSLSGEYEAGVISFSSSSIQVFHKYKGVTHTRSIQILSQSVEIVDECTEEFQVSLDKRVPYSNGYGKLVVNDELTQTD